MKIVLTGVCGLVGRTLASHLIDEGHQIFGICRSECDNFDERLSPNLIHLDLASNESVVHMKKILPSSIDLVIVCTSQQPRDGLMFEDYLKGNISTTENIVEWARNSGVDSIISFSTIAFLDMPQLDNIKITEESNANPKNYYALSKWATEAYLKLACNESNLNVLCFRIPSLVHQDQKGGLINTYFKSAKENINLDIFDHGKFRRSLINIESIKEIINLTIQKLDQFKGFNVFNLGSADSWTLLEIAEYIYKRMDSTAKIYPVNKSSSISGYCNIDSSKAINEIDFIPWNTQKILDEYIEKMIGES